MIRIFTLSIALLGAAGPVLAPHGGRAASSVAVAMPDSTANVCAAIHAALFANGQMPDSATVASLHTLMAAHHSGAQSDSATMAAAHAIHAHLSGVLGDSTAHATLMTAMHSAMGAGAMSDSAAHATIHNAMMTCMHQP